jgi:hypothetical protein
LQRYLFHRTGTRFVRCRACDLVYADPVDTSARGYFDIAALGTHSLPMDHDHLVSDFRTMLRELERTYEERFRRHPSSVLVVGRWHRDFARVSDALRVELATDIEHDEQALLNRPLTKSLESRIGDFDIVLLNEFFEAAHDPAQLLEGLAPQLAPESIVAVSFANMDALPSRVLRRRWKSFFDHKIGYYNADNLEVLMWRSGFRRMARRSLRTTYSLAYLATRLQSPDRMRALLKRWPLARPSVRVASGYQVIVFSPALIAERRERLSIIVPVFNEERYVGEVLRALIIKDVPIDKEIVVVESNSDDRSRDIVRSFEGEPGVRLLLEDQARGKGHAVRAGLAAATGTIVLIQDADFEYDLDDYDALLDPILQHHTSFVLGSRSLGLDDWKVRRYASSKVKGFLMNAAQVAFAKTFSLLYQQKVKDINTMFKVFRRECIDGCHFVGDGFDFDIELVCKIVRNGFSPLEVPVNYVARSFDEGKKINFVFDAYPSYFQLFRCRFGSL